MPKVYLSQLAARTIPTRELIAILGLSCTYRTMRKAMRGASPARERCGWDKPLTLSEGQEDKLFLAEQRHSKKLLQLELSKKYWRLVPVIRTAQAEEVVASEIFNDNVDLFFTGHMSEVLFKEYQEEYEGYVQHTKALKVKLSKLILEAERHGLRLPVDVELKKRNRQLNTSRNKSRKAAKRAWEEPTRAVLYEAVSDELNVSIS
jgi:hypothetical protein